MKKTLFLIAGLLSACGLFSSVGYCQAENSKQKDNHLTINLSPDQWGKVHGDLIAPVLTTSAIELWKYFPELKSTQFTIEHQENTNPKTHATRGVSGNYTIILPAEVRYWAQFAFQFSHEMCHALCRLELRENDYGNNQWFEESLCEAASVFVLSRLVTVWQNDPPSTELKDFVPLLQQYLDNLLAKEYSLPPNLTLRQWYQQNYTLLESEWTEENVKKPGTLEGANGERNAQASRLRVRLVGNALFPFFKSEPMHWEAVSYLNLKNNGHNRPFKEYLQAWYDACPQKHKKFVAKIMAEFGSTQLK